LGQSQKKPGQLWVEMKEVGWRWRRLLCDRTQHKTGMQCQGQRAQRLKKLTGAQHRQLAPNIHLRIIGSHDKDQAPTRVLRCIPKDSDFDDSDLSLSSDDFNRSLTIIA
jgi:hypothetical protein